MSDSVRECLLSFLFPRYTGTPPMALSKNPKGKKNQVLFIKKPAFSPAERMANSPMIKSQLLVCGATQITHFFASFTLTFTLKFQPSRLNITCVSRTCKKHFYVIDKSLHTSLVEAFGLYQIASTSG